VESKLWIVVPAAGDSARFRSAGYTTPKPFLKVGPKEGTPDYMIQFVLDSVPNYDDVEKIIVLRQEVDIPQDFKANPHVLRIQSTKGQADTIYKAVKELPGTDAVLVLDCDMILTAADTGRIVGLMENYDSVIAVTETFDPNASRVDSIPYPTRFVEKEPISQWGIVGARAFKCASDLTDALKRAIDRYETINREPYLSVAINYMPGTKVTHLIHDFVDLGTPERIRESGWRIL